MGVRSTYTYTYYFGNEDLEPLRELHRALEQDWNKRREFIPTTVAMAGDTRLDLLKHAIELLGDRVWQ